MTKRKICVVTGTRAEYGLLYWLMKEIQNDQDLELQIIVTGMHLSPEFGLTYKTIENDGFFINEKIEMLLSSDTTVGVAKSMGLATIGFADALDRLNPDIMVVLGDRYEILSAAQAAMVMRIPIAHLHGGEVTHGAYDDSIRHSVTKMSNIHFVSTEEHLRRVVRLGEHPDSVYNVGAIGVETIKRMEYLSISEIEQKLDVDLDDVIFLITFHPTTLSSNPIEGCNELLEALEQFKDATLIFTKSNADNDGRIINKLTQEFVDKNSVKRKVFTSLGQQLYLSLLRQSNVVIGNSSSGLLEAPYLETPTVNIGNRQGGRTRPASVFDCNTKVEDIVSGINNALNYKFNAKADYQIFGDGDTVSKIISVLKKENILSVNKQFYDGEIV